MSKKRRIAQLIPAEYRKEMLELNMIDSAIAVAGDQAMHYLVVIWTNYIEYDFKPDCNLCRGRVLTNFKAMKKDLIELEQQSNTLKAL